MHTYAPGARPEPSWPAGAAEGTGSGAASELRSAWPAGAGATRAACCRYAGAGSELEDAAGWCGGRSMRGTGCGRGAQGCSDSPNSAVEEGVTGAPKMPQLAGDDESSSNGA